MRLIDADALFKTFEEHGWYNNADRDEIAEKLLLEQPTIDAVQVIRCAECYFWNKEPSQTAMPETHTCRYWRIGTTCVDYCARASRDGWMKAMSKDSRKDIDEEIERAWEYAETD